MANLNVPFSANQQQLALLRLVNWGLKIGLIVFAADLFGLTTPPTTLNYVLIFEACYVGFSYRFHRLSIDNHGLLFLTLLLDTLFWATWLYFTGGATNAFVSLLLLPIAISAITLPRWAPWSLTALSTAIYSLMIMTIPEHGVDDTAKPAAAMADMHAGHDMSQMAMDMPASPNMSHSMDMGSHYLGMWFNFVISALVLTITVGFIAKRIRQKNIELRYLREAQLRQEKILALGTASAQMAHQLATPLATLRLLVDEISDTAHVAEQTELLAEMQQALNRCEVTLSDLRLATESIREQKLVQQSVEQLVALLSEQVSLLMPKTQLSLHISPEAETAILHTDMSLLPALLALIQNGAQASEDNQQGAKVDINISVSQSPSRSPSTQIMPQEISMIIRDYGVGIATHILPTLGRNMVNSPKGMGIAVLLSHTSFERLGGKLYLKAHPQGGTEAIVILPLDAKVDHIGV
ncbi:MULTISPECIES: sensor histidine kinase [Shewanella]|uniref:histidine kinase n=1 Tax=Shewanella metallivivens TaxID=2872342 RepID=A0ABT5TI36_9GAMM|nr:HAMP domain-containing sensor histidine kinase [Shewanella metallivivens]MDD8058271.1 HAMP domain-containing sensor histidine kinase [Shewanella metallivivens]